MLFKTLAAAVALACVPGVAQQQDLAAVKLAPKEIVLTLGSHEIKLTDLRFGRKAGYNTSVFVPEIEFSAENTSPILWNPMDLQVTVGAMCDGTPQQFVAPMSVVVRDNHPVFKEALRKTIVRQNVDAFKGKLNRCTVELLDLTLISAKGDDGTVITNTPEPVDFMPWLREIQGERQTAEAAAAVAREEKRRRLVEAAERMKREELLEQRKQEEAQRRREAAIRTACAAIYKRTYRTKLADLTVKDTEEIQACKALGYYSAQ